jgi:DNA-binding MarR family transcriptional regulator
MTAAYAPLLEPLGLTYPQYLVMLVLWEGDGLSVTALGERLHLDSGTVTPLLKKLEAMQYLTRRRDERDERVVRVSLTTIGQGLRKKALTVPRALFCQTGLDLKNLARLREELMTLTHTLRAANAQRIAHTKETP